MACLVFAACSSGPGGSGSPDPVDAGVDAFGPGEIEEVGVDASQDVTADTEPEVTPDPDTGADAATDADADIDIERDIDESIPAVTGLEASDSTFVDRIELTWDEVEGATAYVVYRAGFEIAEVTTNTYADTEAPYASVSYDTIEASQGTLHDRIEVQVAGTELSDIPEVPYTVAARVGLPLGPESEVDTGSRAPGDLTCAWERATVDATDAFTALDGPTDLLLTDSDDAAVGESRLYRCRFEVEGIELGVTEVAEGYRGGCEDGIVAAAEFEQFVDCGGVCPIACSAPEVLTDSLPDAFRAEDYARLLEWAAVPPVSSVEVSVPAWADFDVETGELTGTPYVTDLGTTDVEITLLNDVDEVTVTIPLTARNRRIEQLEAGGHACAIIEGGTLRCWGSNEFGQLGYGNNIGIGGVIPVSHAGDVDFGEPVVDVAVGYQHTCALGASGDVKCWGHVGAYEAGVADVVSVGTLPEEVPRFLDALELSGAVTGISSTAVGACAHYLAGGGQCWRWDESGRIQVYEDLEDRFPVTNVLDIWVAGSSPSAILDDEGAVWYADRDEPFGLGFNRLSPFGGVLPFGFWARNDAGDWLWRAGLGGLDSYEVLEGTRVMDVAGGEYSACLVTVDGTVECLGVNIAGLLGEDAPAYRGEFEEIFAGEGFDSLILGVDFGCAFDAADEGLCWGGDRDFAFERSRTYLTTLDGSDELQALTGLSDDLQSQYERGLVNTLRLAGMPEQFGTDYGAPADEGSPLWVVEAPPVFLNEPTLVATVGSVWTYEPEVALDGDPFTIEAVEVPSGMTFTETAGGYELEWVPGPEAIGGENVIILRSSDGARTIDFEFSVTVFPSSPVRDLACGAAHCCAVIADADVEWAVACWGRNEDGQATGTPGVGVDASAGIVRSRVSLSNPVAARDDDGDDGLIAAGSAHTCVVAERGDGSGGGTLCWGNNDYGQVLGNDGVPGGIVGPAGNVTRVFAGYDNTCAEVETDDGYQLHCWGANDSFVHSTFDFDAGPNWVRLPDGVGRLQDVAIGFEHMCLLDESGRVFCWGRGTRGQLGEERAFRFVWELPSAAPIDFGSDRVAVSIDSGEFTTCAVLDDLSVHCWGAADDGVLGAGTDVDATSPTVALAPVPGRENLLTVGTYHACVVRDGETRCWGRDNPLAANPYFSRAIGGVLGLALPLFTIGDDEGADTVTPVDVEGITLIANGDEHTCALLADATVRCWGLNQEGQLGTGDGRTIGDNETAGKARAVRFY